MEFTEAIEIIKNIVPESSVNEYDGIMVKGWKHLIHWMKAEQRIRPI